jgi:general secretion pathway protein G
MSSPLFRSRGSRRTGSRRGLTLVEIIIVIAILSTLMALVAGTMLGAQDEANVDLTKLQMQKVKSSLEMYAAKHSGKYPTTSEGLAAAKKWLPNGEVPTDTWGNEFQYYSPGTHSEQAYELISLGKDGQEGGEETDADINSWELGKGNSDEK